VKDENSEVVRRSSESELLERIKCYAISGCDYGLCGWINHQLGVESDFSERGVSEEEYGALCTRFGPLRKSQHLLTDKPTKFGRFVFDAYIDAVRYPEFTGIEIKASSVFVSGGSTTKTYCFEAKLNEMLGLTGLVYETKLSFEYPHPHEEGEHNIENYVSGQLGDLKSSLLAKLTDAEMVVKDKTLYVSKKQEETD